MCPRYAEVSVESGHVFAGKYQIVGPLGKGGMGTVYEAIHLASGQPVALKLITGVEINDEVLLRFIREAESAERIDSPNVVRIFDLGSDLDTGIPYMAMEKLTGSDISHMLRALGPIPPNTAAKIALQSAAGLAKAHDHGVVHRDIKPGNLFVATSADGSSAECTVKVLDFGIAKLTEDAGQDREELTQTGSVLGSPHYMSPEQAQGLKNIDARSDIWSLGVVLYKMLCGKAPHADFESLGQIIVAICSRPAVPVQTLAPWVPPELSAIVDRALRIEPAERYQSAREFEAALAQFLGPDRKLYTDDIRAVNDIDRMYVAPRAAMQSDSEPGSFGTQNSLELSYHRLEQRKGRRGPWLYVGGGLLALAVIAGGVTVGLGGLRQGGDPMPEATLEAELPSTAAGAGSAVVMERFEVKDVEVMVVAPEGAQIFVDSRITTLHDGRITISGSLGSEHEVRIVEGGRDKRESITIAESGARPNRVVYTVVANPAPTDGSGSGSGSSTSHSRGHSPPPTGGAPAAGGTAGGSAAPPPQPKTGQPAKPSGTSPSKLKPTGDFE